MQGTEKTLFGNIVDVKARRSFSGKVTVCNGKIASIEEMGSEQEGVYILPGYVDSHIQIESTLMVPQNYARMAVASGVVAAVCDPHEIANVLGTEGVDFMIEDGFLDKYVGSGGDVVIPEGVTEIGENAFSGCTALTSVTLPEGVTSIGSSEFSSCSYLATITIPKSVDLIYEYAFADSKRLKTVNFEGTVAEWYAITKGNSWNEQCPFTVVHCSDGDVKLS